MRHDFGVGEAAHLVADGLKRLVEAGIAERGIALALLDQLDNAGAGLRRGALDQRAHRRREEGGLVRLRDAKLMQPRRLALAHHHAA